MALAVMAAGAGEMANDAEPARSPVRFLPGDGPGLERRKAKTTITAEPVANAPLAPAPSTPTPALPLTDVQASFLEGYRAGGGDPAWERHWIDDVVPCESQWNVDPPGIHYGLAQFAEGTWHSAKCSPDADYRSAWEQGCAVASWMAAIAPNWGTTAGWPVCFWR